MQCGRLQGPANFVHQRTYSSTTCSGSVQQESWYVKNTCIETGDSRKRFSCVNSDVQSVVYGGANCTGTETKNTYSTTSCFNSVVVGARFDCGAASSLKIVFFFTIASLFLVLI